MSILKLAFRAVLPFVCIIVVSQSLKNPPPIWWSFMWALPALIVLCAACVMGEIAALRQTMKEPR